MIFRVIYLILVFFLFGCSHKTSILDERGLKEKTLQQSARESYVVFGKRYFPLQEVSDFEETGIASWYGKKFHGKPTSIGETYDMYAMTAAHKTLPLPSLVRVINLQNKKTVLVKVNDRGPFIDGRIIDLSYAAAKALGMARLGTAKVRVSLVKILEEERKPKSRFIQFGAFRVEKNAINLLSVVNKKLPEFQGKVVKTEGGIFKVISSIPLENVIPTSKLKSNLEEAGISEYSILIRR